MLLLLILLFVAELAIPVVFIFIFGSSLVSALHGAPYVPMGNHKILDILRVSDLNSEDIFYDLGCGDGRILLAAIRNFRVKKAIGYEVSPWPYLKCRRRIRRSHLNNVQVIRQNFFEADLGEATFVYAYLLPKLMQRLAKKLEAELKPGSRVLCPAFPIDLAQFPGFELIKAEKVAKLSTYLYRKL